MGLAFTLVRRSLLQRAGRTLFSVLGIGLGIATVVAVNTLDHNTVEGLRQRVSGDWRPELELTPSRELADPLALLGATEGVASAAVYFQNDVIVSRPDGRATGRGATTRARLLAVQAKALPEMGAHRLVAGEELDPAASEPQALVGAALARSLGIGPGDRIELSRPRRATRRECVDGVLREVADPRPDAPLTLVFEVRGLLAPEGLGRRASGEMLLVDHRHGRSLFRDARVDERFWVRPAAEADLQKLQSELSRSFAYDVARNVLVGRTADERAFRNGVLLAGLLALVLGLYVIFHTLSTSLVERVVEIGTLGALGATRARIAGVMLLEAAILSGLGGLLGLGLGIGVARALLLVGITTLGSKIHLQGFAVPWGAVLPISALGVALAMLGAVFPLLRARDLGAVEALRGERDLRSLSRTRGFHLFAALLLALVLPTLYFTITPVVGAATATLVGAVLVAIGALALLVSLPFLVPRVVLPLVRVSAPILRRAGSFSGRMAAAAMLSDPRRIAVSVSAVALVAAALVGLKGMTRSLTGEIEAWAERAVLGRLYVSGLPQVPFEELREQLRALPGVLGIEPDGARAFVPFLLIGLPTEELLGHGPLASDARLAQEFEERGGMVLSLRLARSFGWQPGDRIQAATGGGVQSFEVLAVSDAYGYFPFPDERMYGVISATSMRQHFCQEAERVERISLRLAPGCDPDGIAMAIRELTGGEIPLTFLSGEALLDLHVEDIDSDFRLFDILLGLTALLAAIGVLNGLLLSALERESELGILRALGTSKRQIAGMVLLEAGCAGLWGGILGLAFGLALTPMIVRSLELLSGLALPVRGAGPWPAFALLGAIALPLLAALYPIHRMSRVDPVRAVRSGRVG